MKKQIVLIGGGGHCRSIIDVIEQEGKFEIVGIVDKKDTLGLSILGYKIIADDSDLLILAKQYQYAFIAVGQIKTAELRIKLFTSVELAGFSIPSIISPRAYISNYSSIEKGTIVMHDAVINANSSVGKNCIINSKSLIEHDVKVEDHCHISTGAIINGGASIGRESFIGSGSVIREGLELNSNSFIKAGSLGK